MTTDQTPDRRDEADADVVANRAAQVITRMGAEIRALKGERDRYRTAWRSARERAQAYGEGILRVVKDREQCQEWLRQAEERAAVPSAAAPPTQADAPVKQRADCTELEWAEQERARFERLYTRETVRADLAEKRADTAARDADIYQQRLERLGEGYTRERKRAERAEAEAERLRTYRDATCICQHTEQQHFEDACLVCDCGDYLPPAAAREVIARYQQAAKRETADRPAVLNAAAQHLYTALFPAVYDDMGQKAAEGVQRAVSELRRLAEAPQPETQAALCGRTRSTSGEEYPPCARTVGHAEAYCRTADGNAYFLGVAAHAEPTP